MAFLADQFSVRLLLDFEETLQESTCGNRFNFTRTALSQTGLLTSLLEQLAGLDTGPYWCQNSSEDDEAEEDEPVEEAEEEDESVEEAEEEDESVGEAEEETDHFRARDMLPLQVSGRD